MTSPVTPPASHREPAQILAIFAVALVALVAFVGAVLDGGNLYVQRRTAQIAADAATLAGTRALRFATAASNTSVAQAICTYVNANAFGITPAATAYFVGMDGATNVGAISLPSGCSGTPANTTIPNTASGVHVDTQIGPFSTYLLGVVGVSTLSAEAHASAQVGLATGLKAGQTPPLAGCGDYMITAPQGAGTDILGGTGTAGDPYYVPRLASQLGGGAGGPNDFILQSSQMTQSQPTPPCPSIGGNSSWKGMIIPPASGTVTLPTSVPLDNGNTDADLAATCLATGQPAPTNAPGVCRLLIPIAAGGVDVANLVAFACFDVYEGSNGTEKWRGVLVDGMQCPPYASTYTTTWTFGSNNGQGAKIMLTN